MDLPQPLYEGRLLKRYKRFLADIELADGEVITAHCANPGSMMGVAPAGARVWVSKSDNKKRKLPFSWELVEITEYGKPALVGINTNNPNKIAFEAIENGLILELNGYAERRREVKYGTNSRIDILLENAAKPPCYVEIKNVHLLRRTDGLAEFPDSVTARGLKHLQELTTMVTAGNRAVMLFVIQRPDCTAFAPAADIDPKYAEGLKLAAENGVEILAWDCAVSLENITLRQPLPVHLG
jgi:sugar fermentation stimulation protein A